MMQTETIKENETYIPTLNKMGYTTSVLCSYTTDFINYCGNCTSPVADIGVGHGFSTQKILKASNRIVYANDIEAKHLEILEDSITKDEKERLILMPGKIQEVFDVPPNTLSGILAARVFHFLKGEDIEHVLDMFYKSLIKNGKVFITAETPYISTFKKFVPLYRRLKRRGVKWPGVIPDISRYTNRPNLPSFVNVLDPDILSRAVRQVGFKIEKSGFFDRPYFPIQVRNNGRESVGIIGVKV